MRQRLVQVLTKDDRDEPMDALVRRFWSQSARRPIGPTGAGVVDLSSWRRARDKRPR